MKKRIVLIIGIIVVLFGALFGIHHVATNGDSDGDNVVKIAVYPTGTLSHTYLVKLNADNGRLSVECGTRNIDMNGIDFSDKHFFMRELGLNYEKDNVKLSNDEVAEVINMLNAIYDDESCIYTGEVTDSWAITILYNNEMLKNNSFKKSPELKELVNKLLDKTDIEHKFQGFS